MTSEVGIDADSPLRTRPGEKYCIICARSDDKMKKCSGCKSVWYCDKKCQMTDWRCHKILCSKYVEAKKLRKLNPGRQYGAFLFRFDSVGPEIVALPSPNVGSGQLSVFVNLLRTPGDPELGPSFMPFSFGFNRRLRRENIGKYQISVTLRTRVMINNPMPNKSLVTSVKAIGSELPPHYWYGNILVSRNNCESVTMADFRHTLDWFAMYPRDALYAVVAARTPLDLKQVWPSFCFSTIRGVQIQGGREFKETERYKAVDVPADSSIRGLFSQLQGEISPISKRLGRPLRLISEPSKVHASSWEHELPSCGPVTALLRSLTKDLDAPSPGMLFSLPRGGLLRDNRALVVRADDKDLSIDELRAMAYFAEYMCNVKIYGVVRLPREDEPALEAAMKEALDFMTWDNCLLAFDKLRIPRHQQPAKEMFVDTRDAARPEDL